MTSDPAMGTFGNQGSQLEEPKTKRKPLTRRALEDLLKKHKTGANRNLTGGNSSSQVEGLGNEKRT
ncbi:hypothetical protein FF255_18520, partial [Bordetella pertussis]